MLRTFFIASVVMCIVLLVSNNVLSADLIAHWPLDQNSGEEVKDVVGSHNGKIIGGNVNWVRGQFGNGLQLKGARQYVEVQKSKDLELVTVTLVAWVNPDSLAGRQEIASYADSYGIFLTGGVFKVLLYNGKDWNTASGITKVEQGKWYQVAETVAKTEIKLYVNGALDTKLATPAIAFQNFAMWFGGGPADNQFWLTGTIDEIEIWNGTLSDAEIEKIFKAPPSLGAVYPTDKLTTTWGNVKN